MGRGGQRKNLSAAAEYWITDPHTSQAIEREGEDEGNKTKRNKEKKEE